MLRICLLGLLSALFMQPSWGAPGNSLTVMEAYDNALKNDPAFQSASYGYQASQEDRSIGLAPLLPQLSLGSRYGDTKQISGQEIDSNDDDRFTSSALNLSARQAVYDKSRYASYEQAQARSKAGEALYQEASQEVFNRILEAYFEVARQENQLRLTRQQKTATEGLVKQTRRLFEAGDGTITDTEEAQARLDLISAQEIEDLARLQAAFRTLSGRTGMPVTSILAMNENLPETPLLPNSENLEYWQELARNNSPKLYARKAGIEIAEAELNIQRAGNYPTLALVSDVNRAEQDNLQQDARSQSAYYLGLTLDMPIYSGGGVIASSRKSEYQLSGALSDMDNERQKLSEEIERNYLGTTSGYLRSKALKTAVRSNQRALESAEKGYQAGIRSTVDILNAQQTLFATRRDFLNSKLVMLQSYVGLYVLSGRMERIILMRIEQFY